MVGWAERNVHAFVNVGGPTLGLPKAFAALLSGEMKDKEGALLIFQYEILFSPGLMFTVKC